MNNRLLLGLDIGGANTKSVLIKCQEGKIIKAYPYIEYFPFWEKSKKTIAELFKRIILYNIQANGFKIKDLDKIAITMTAELSDAFQTKREGILTILNALKNFFPPDLLIFINNKNIFINIEELELDPLQIAAANWVSTALYLGQFVPKCILIDAGSTTIDIIPISDSIPCPRGRNDITRLQNHELIYTGGLRATIPSIIHFVPFKGEMVRISFERFALISDIHLILGNITEKEYTNDTADNRSTSLDDCFARLSRVICMDLESISKEELIHIANYIYEKQLEIIKDEINLFYNKLISRLPEFKENPQFILTGSSAKFLAFKAVNELSFNKTINYYDTITDILPLIPTSAFTVAAVYYFNFFKMD